MPTTTALPSAAEIDAAGLYSEWLGKKETRYDIVAEREAAALAATLNYVTPPLSGDPLPPLWHWVYFTPAARQAQLGHDGHPKRTSEATSFLPPMPLPNRMWAGGRLQFIAPLIIGAPVERHSRILHIREKTGAAGALVFVTVAHEIFCNNTRALYEEHDIVYRAPMPSGQARPSKEAPPDIPVLFAQQTSADAVLLFRYSALTFNSHRIHYDQAYVTQVEAYPGLIVHGPLLATLLLEHLRRSVPLAQVCQFNFRIYAPVFAGEYFTLCIGAPEASCHDENSLNHRRYLLWIERAGVLILRAEADIL